MCLIPENSPELAIAENVRNAAIFKRYGRFASIGSGPTNAVRLCYALSDDLFNPLKSAFPRRWNVLFDGDAVRHTWLMCFLTFSRKFFPKLTSP